MHNNTRLLILDGHGHGHASHATEDFAWECFSHRIQLLYLPARNTSHVLQPLDLAIFGPLKHMHVANMRANYVCKKIRHPLVN